MVNTSRHLFLLLIAIIVLHIYLLISTKFTLWPEMLVYPYLFNNGFTLYKDLINPYPPFLTVSLSLFAKVFGYIPQAYQIFTWFLIVIADILIFFIATKITKKVLFGILSLLFFTILSMIFGINGLWFDLVQTPFILISFFYFYKFLKSNKYRELLIAFAFTSAAIFIKQQAAWLAIWFLILLSIEKRTLFTNNLGKLIGIFLPLLFISLFHLAVFYKIGLLNEYIFWNFSFPLFEASNAPGYILLPTLRQLLTTAFLFIIFVPIIFSKEYGLKIIFYTALFLLIFTYPRFDYFHIIPSLAILSLAFGSLISILKTTPRTLKIVSIAALLLLSTLNFRYLINNWGLSIRFFEPGIYTTATFMSLISQPTDKFYIQNGPDQLLPLAQRLPPKPWADEFPWYLEIEGAQNKIVQGIKNEEPNYIIFQPYSEGNKYDLGSYRPGMIVDFIDKNFKTESQITNFLWLKTKIQ